MTSEPELSATNSNHVRFESLSLSGRVHFVLPTHDDITHCPISREALGRGPWPKAVGRCTATYTQPNVYTALAQTVATSGGKGHKTMPLLVALRPSLLSTRPACFCSLLLPRQPNPVPDLAGIPRHSVLQHVGRSGSVRQQNSRAHAGRATSSPGERGGEGGTPRSTFN